MAVNIHITIIELNALHTKRQNLFQELDAVIHLLMEAKHWGLRKSRNATSLNSRCKSLDTLKVKIISVTFRRVIRTNHKKASKIWRHDVILVVWFLLPRVARLMIHTPTAISIFVCLSMVQLMAVFISMRCTLCGHFLQVALTLILVVGYAIAAS